MLYLAPVIYLAEMLARPIDYVIETLKWPGALGTLGLQHTDTLILVCERPHQYPAGCVAYPVVHRLCIADLPRLSCVFGLRW